MSASAIVARSAARIHARALIRANVALSTRVTALPRALPSPSRGISSSRSAMTGPDISRGRDRSNLWIEENVGILRDEVEGFQFDRRPNAKHALPKELDLAIAEDHRAILSTYSRYVVSGDPVEKRFLLDDLIRRIAVHAAAEELVLYSEQDSVKGLAFAHSHAEVRDKLQSLEAQGLSEERFDSILHEIIMDFKEHVSTEETVTLPSLRTSLGQDAVATMRELGLQYQNATTVVPRQARAPASRATGPMLPAGSVAAVWDAVSKAVGGVRA
ncbi:hypothetical protein M427DRAFT_53933 [Gonapodya prolifera JEL478]|uniref:Hemerythrin-like domain-containing protein n=1 Tax=Gonapodya prolifera (strain JEL478) TaxID=1344416 RepID=A0A139AMU1_GONPJ|nr:hypothetical protein M427DRAFT_53933 [Gonapodya prolifera JEL478]|eukprot:KXS18087.1 hypothetical protein M427DRAFT_53933 [Gonapodya prolifera JEL478]